MRRILFCFALFSLVAAPARSGPVAEHGRLHVKGAQIVGADDRPVSLAGNSLFWSQWQGAFWNADCVAWLRQDWHSQVIRAAVGVEGGGYLDHPDRETERLEHVVDACIANDLYVIIDWHDHAAPAHLAQAKSFFQAMARKYGGDPHVMYEIFNEPKDVSWSGYVKPYAEEVVAAIRAIDPHNLIIVGSPHWSQDVDVAAKDPLHGDNLAYALHFYAGTHKQWLRDKADEALRHGCALFVTEWGTCDSDGAGAVDRASTAEWMDFLRARQISHCNWAVSDKDETSSIVVSGASPRGNWKASELTASGALVRQIVREWQAPAPASTTKL